MAVALSLLIHAKGLGSPPLDYHSHRQVNTAMIARNYHRFGEFLTPRVDFEGPSRGPAGSEFPLYMWLVGALWPVLGLGQLWGRILSALCSAAGALYLLRLLEDETGPEPAFYGALLFCALPIEVYFGRTIQPEAMALLGTLGALYHWRRALEPSRPWGHWAAASAWTFLAVGLKLPYGYLFAVLAALSAARLGWRRALADRRTWLAGAAAAAGVAAWYWHARSGSFVVPVHQRDYVRLVSFEQGLLEHLRLHLISRWPELTATYGGVLLFFIGARQLWRRNSFLFAWWALAAAAIVAGGKYTYSHEYTSLPLAPINAAFMGVGFAAMLSRARGRAWATAGVAILALSVPAHTALRISHWYRVDHEFMIDARRAADAVSAPDDLFVTNQRAASLYLYFLDRRGWSIDFEEHPRPLAWLDERIADGAGYLMTPSAAFGPARAYARAVRERYPLAYDRGGVLIFRLDATGPRPPAGPASRPAAR